MPTTEVAKHGKVEDALSRAYTKQSCKDGRHILLSLPGLTRDDIEAMPKLVALATSPKLPGRFQIPHVVDSIDASLVQSRMEEACGPATVLDSKSWLWNRLGASDAKLAVYKSDTLPEESSQRSQALQKLGMLLRIVTPVTLC